VVRYVGRSKYDDPKKRLKKHLLDCRNRRKADWIQSVLSDGGEVVATVLESGLAHDTSCTREMFYIAHYRGIGHPLTNGVIGALAGVSHKRIDYSAYRSPTQP